MEACYEHVDLSVNSTWQPQLVLHKGFNKLLSFPGIYYEFCAILNTNYVDVTRDYCRINIVFWMGSSSIVSRFKGSNSDKVQVFLL
jgi:hypothetical protein